MDLKPPPFGVPFSFAALNLTLKNLAPFALL